MQDYKRNAFMEANLRFLNAIQSMKKKLIASYQVPDANIDLVSMVNIFISVFFYSF